MANEFDTLNTEVAAWAKDTDAVIHNTGAAYGIKHSSNSPSPSASLPKVRGRIFFKDQVAAGIAFKFNRTLVYPHHGAGKGKGGSKGSRWVDKYGITRKTNPKSFNKMNTGNRKAKPFLNDALKKQAPLLANIVAQTGADIVTRKLFIQ